jgi:hypothetical protein
VLCQLSYVGDAFAARLSCQSARNSTLERETGFEPVTFSLEG